MKIHSPLFSGSITQSDKSFAELSGSFTGSFTGSFVGTIEVEEATFNNLTIIDTISVGSDVNTNHPFTGSINVSGSVNVVGGNVTIDGSSVEDISIIYAIALG